MSTWTKQKLGDAVTFRTGKLNSNAAVVGGKYPFFTCSQEIYKTDTFSFDTECVLLGGNNASAVYPIFYFKGKFDAYQRTYVIEPKKENNIRFLYFALRKKLSELQKQSTGATTKFLTIKILNGMQIEIADLPTQARIASVLSAYDDLIENNERRIKRLEEMAQLLYTEWFVKFKFPGHEKTKLVDSGTDYGKVLEGWEVKNISECFEILGGGTPSRTESKYWSGTINWYTPTDLTGANQMFSDISLEKITELGLKNSSAKLFPPYSIMITSRATIGAISINTNHSTTNQGFIVCIPNARTPLHYLYFWLKDHVRLFIDLGSGATFKEISKGSFKKIKILLPESGVLENFEKKLKTIGDSILFLQRKNKALSKTRDLLIPQLVTGRRELK